MWLTHSASELVRLRGRLCREEEPTEKHIAGSRCAFDPVSGSIWFAQGQPRVRHRSGSQALARSEAANTHRQPSLHLPHPPLRLPHPAWTWAPLGVTSLCVCVCVSVCACVCVCVRARSHNRTAALCICGLSLCVTGSREEFKKQTNKPTNKQRKTPNKQGATGSPPAVPSCQL